MLAGFDQQLAGFVQLAEPVLDVASGEGRIELAGDDEDAVQRDVVAIAERQEVVAAFAVNPSAGVVAIGGVMYDRPHLTRAERLLARVREAS